MSQQMNIGLAPPAASLCQLEHPIEEHLGEALSQGFQFVIAPLTLPDSPDDALAFTNSQILFNTSQWNARVLGRIALSTVTALCSTSSSSSSSPSPTQQQTELSHATHSLAKQVAWAVHLSLQAVVLPVPSTAGLSLAHYARQISSSLLRYVGVEFLVEVPLTAAGWTTWDTLRTAANSHALLSVALVVPADLPTDEEGVVFARWKAEPIRVIVLPVDVFVFNADGFPMLGVAHQLLLLELAEHTQQLVLQGEPKHVDGRIPYLAYLHHMFESMDPHRDGMSLQSMHEIPYRDVLQSPLQPLQDNLHSQTYEVFERDPVKYRQYQHAVRDALLERHPDKDERVVIAVVGAGRGPLVRASLAAAETTQHHKVHVYCIEKNPNAVVTLRALLAAEPTWQGRVTLVDTDMREWTPPEQMDILVSELLGSFGDNELSPECLDGAQRCLKDTGISIPCQSTSFLAPIATPMLWSQLDVREELKAFEMGYVVNLHAHYRLAPPQPCFEFVHPNPEDVDNTRFAELRFTAEADSNVHGLAGYFCSQLFGEHSISIHPDTFSDGMFSWFPIYFPLRTPVSVRAGDTLTAHMWRCCGDGKVWYEWSLSTDGQHGVIHNPNGRSWAAFM